MLIAGMRYFTGKLTFILLSPVNSVKALKAKKNLHTQIILLQVMCNYLKQSLLLSAFG